MLYYLWSINKYVGKYGLYDEEEIMLADKLEKQWLESQPRYTFQELLKIFPAAKPYLKKKLKQEIKKWKEDLKQAEETRINFNNKILSKSNPEDRWFWTLVRDIIFLEPLKENKEKKIKRNSFYLALLKRPNKKEIKQNSNKITDFDIQRAREIPIDSLYFGQLKKKNNIMWGLCPFHPEKNPSFAIYLKDNHFYCYGCNEAGDSIDFIMKRDGCDFITAVRRLINK